MFNMKQAMGSEDVGYQLRITYNKAENKFYVAGYSIRANMQLNPTSGQYTKMDQDGAVMEFPTMKAAIESITKYEHGVIESNGN